MIGGLDLLRLIALVLITWQHAASNLGYYEVTQWRGISPGQVGVALFCAISGLLAFRFQPTSMVDWLRKRLARIFPAYWIVTIVAFLLALMASIKKPTLGLFVSQMLGFGFFTHGGELINVVSWFISLILLCYVIAAISWSSGRPAPVLYLVTLLAAVLCLFHLEVGISRHVMSFALAGLASLAGRKALLWLVGVALLVTGLLAEPSYSYSGISLLAVLAILRQPLSDPKWVSQLSEFSYEYFLVHGIFLVGMTQLISEPWQSIPAAIALSAMASVILSRVCHPVVSWVLQFSLPPSHSGSRNNP